MNRRAFVRASAAAAGTALFPLPSYAAGALAADAAAVRLGYLGKPCDAATLTAPGSGPFSTAGLAPRLTRFADEDRLIAALAAGTLDAGSVTLAALLAPLARGADVRIVAGLHAGCLRVVAPDAIELGGFANLRGKTLGTDRLGGPAMNLFSALLRKNGIDPRRDVSWRVYAPADLETALAAKTVTCIAAADPLGYALLRAKQADPYLDAADGGFSCGGDIAHGHQCFLAVSGRVVDAHPHRAAAIARAYLGSSSVLARGVGPASVAEVRGGYVDADMYGAVGMLSSYDWSASTELVLEEIELTARDFRRAGLLPHATDPEALAERAFADVLHA